MGAECGDGSGGEVAEIGRRREEGAEEEGVQEVGEWRNAPRWPNEYHRMRERERSFECSGEAEEEGGEAKVVERREVRRAWTRGREER